jgi:cyclophilin family peptidyl-prolyl cis-trans isomerase
MMTTSSSSRVRRFAAASLSIAAFAFLTVLLTFPLSGCGDKQESSNSANRSATTPKPADPNHKNPTAIIETDAGTIKVELLETDAPVTVENFRKLAERGFYNGVIFHRVISGFMIQGGDPKGDGTGGQTASGQPLPNEINPGSPLYRSGYQRGMVAMANKGRPETGTSQFFIMHKNYPLQPNYTIFGTVTEGIDVVDKIASAPTGPNNRPVDPVKMKKVRIE